MLNVLFVTRKWSPAIGGMETYSLQLVKELSKLTNLTVIKLPGRVDGSPPSLKALLLFMFKSMYRIAVIKSRHVIHVGDLVLWPLAFVAQIFHPKAQIVITAYGLDIVYGTRKGVLPRIYKAYLAIGVKLCNKRLRVIAISNSTRELCCKAGFLDVVVVSLGVERRDIAKYEECSVEPPYILFAGRLVKRKGCGWFVRNVLPLLDNTIRLVVVGKLWDKTETDAIANNNRVEYKGVTSDVELASLRRNAIAVIMPNIHSSGQDVEGFGLTALEAGADGGILLASGIEGITDAVVDGVTGFLLPSEKPEIWSDKIHELADWTKEERLQFIQKAHEVIGEKYSWSRVASDTVAAYEMNVFSE